MHLQQLMRGVQIEALDCELKCVVFKNITALVIGKVFFFLILGHNVAYIF